MRNRTFNESTPCKPRGRYFDQFDMFNSTIPEERMFLGRAIIIQVKKDEVIYLTWQRERGRKKLKPHSMRLNTFNRLTESGFWVKGKKEYFDYQTVAKITELLIQIDRWGWE